MTQFILQRILAHKHVMGFPLIAFSILHAFGTIGTNSIQAQERSNIPNLHQELMVADKDVPDMLGHLGAETIFTQSYLKTLERIFELKQESIKRRIEMAEALLKHERELEISQREQAKRLRTVAYFSIQELGKDVSKSEANQTEVDSAVLSTPFTRDMAEEMLRVALLEQQRLRWDIAAEMELVSARTSSHRTLNEANQAEIQIAKLGMEDASAKLESLKREWRTRKDLASQGAASVTEVQTLESQVGSSEIALRAARAKLQLVEAKIAASENQELAGSKEELVRLLARKKSVDENIRNLKKVIPAFHEIESQNRNAQQLENSAESTQNRCSDLDFQIQELKLLSKLIQDTVAKTKKN